MSLSSGWGTHGISERQAEEQTHFGRTLDDVIIENQITIVRDEKHRAGAAF
jgi:hypothetical protein